VSRNPHAGHRRHGFIAHCEAKGVTRDVSLFLMQDEPVAPGDFVMVHVGYAIQKMTRPGGPLRLGTL
jgi:hydrogenase assembly chaperone HypC/HupF